MRNSFWALGAVLAPAALFVAPAGADETIDALIAEATQSSLAYEIVESLTTEVGPRLAGTEAELRAREWAVAELTRLGFDNVRVEQYGMPVWERGPLEVEILAPYPQRLIATALGGSASTPAGGVEGELAYFASFADLQAAPATGLEGKIVYVDDAMTRTQTGQGYGPAVAKRGLAWSEAQSRGAVAVMIRSVGTDSHRMPHTGNMRMPDARPEIAAVAVSAPDADQIRRIAARGETMRVRLASTTSWRDVGTSGNVIAEVRGREAPDEIVLIGAHLDSWDLGTGAIDDGAGVGIVVAAAKLIADMPQRPRRTVRVVLFGAEEVGLFGAKAYAEAHADELPNHIMAAESDFGADRIWRIGSYVGSGALETMDAIAASVAHLGVVRGGNYAGGGPDVTPLKAAGVPILEPDQSGWDYFDLHHTPDDTFDKIDPDALAQNVAVYAALIYQIADSDVDFRAEAEVEAD